MGPDDQVVRGQDELEPDLVQGVVVEGEFAQPGALSLRMSSSMCARWRWQHSRTWMSGSSWSVRTTWKRCPSWSVNDSCAPGCARSRRTINRDPAGHARRSTWPVISATSPLPRRALRGDRRNPGVLGDFEDRLADLVGQLVAH